MILGLADTFARARPPATLRECGETAVEAAGETAVAAPGLGIKQALVLDDGPRLLSVDLLARHGYAMSWGPNGCSISRPGEAAITLKVSDGKQVLSSGARSAGCASSERVARAKKEQKMKGRNAERKAGGKDEVRRTCSRRRG